MFITHAAARRRLQRQRPSYRFPSSVCFSTHAAASRRLQRQRPSYFFRVPYVLSRTPLASDGCSDKDHRTSGGCGRADGRCRRGPASRRSGARPAGRRKCRAGAGTASRGRGRGGGEGCWAGLGPCPRRHLCWRRVEMTTEPSPARVPAARPDAACQTCAGAGMKRRTAAWARRRRPRGAQAGGRSGGKMADLHPWLPQLLMCGQEALNPRIG